MTVREWFRLQRRAQWEHEIDSAIDLRQLAEQVTTGQSVERWVRIGFLYIVFSAEEWRAETAKLELIEQLIRRSLWEIEESLRHRRMIEHHAKGITE